MNEPIETGEIVVKPWYRKDIVVFIAGSIIVAFMLVLVSMALYTSSGASLLDLSRPGYTSVQSKVDQTDTFEAFSADGPVNVDTINQFQQLYQKQIKPVSSSSDFDSAALQDQALGIDDPGADQ
jgi:hypothetical protein